MVKFLIVLLILGVIIIEFLGVMTGGLRYSRLVVYAALIIALILLYLIRKITGRKDDTTR